MMRQKRTRDNKIVCKIGWKSDRRPKSKKRKS
jgi:hypothetical protein